MTTIIMGFVCEECGVIIKQRCNFKRHVIRFHGNPVGYNYDLCVYFCYRKHNVKKCTKNVHRGRPKRQRKSEAAIHKALEKHLNSDYILELEKIFNNFRSYGKGGLLRYDFAISPVKGKTKYFIIEYDESHHYLLVKWSKEISNEKALDWLEEVQINDSQKNEYVRLHGYPILRISYGQYEEVEKLVINFLGKHGLL